MTNEDEIAAFEAWQEGGLRVVGENVRKRKRRYVDLLDALQLARWSGYCGA
jgi:hypothetical protein